MSALVNAETVTLQAAKETAAETLARVPAATNPYQELQVNPGGLGGFNAAVDRVIPSPLSRRRQREIGININLKSAPSVSHDLDKDIVDFFGDGMFMALGKHPGNTGLSVFKATAVTATGYTVPALGALTPNFLIRARGFDSPANNGVKVATGASTSTEIKTPGLAAETPTLPLGVLVEVAGWRGASGDIGLDASGNLTSAASVFLGLGLTVGQEIFIGGDLGTAITNFATSGYRGWATIKIIAAAKLTLERRRWTVGAADTGAAKTIDIYFGRCWRNVPSDHADSLTGESAQPNYTLELSLPGAAAAGATSYYYGIGSMINMVKFDMPALNKATVSIDFVGRDMAGPTVTRATGAATSIPPIGVGRFNTVDHVTYVRVLNASDETALLVDIDSVSIDLMQNIKPQNQQGTYGAKRMSVGKVEVSGSIKGYLVQDDTPKAVRDSRIATFGYAIRNSDGALFFNIPSFQLSGGAPDFQENGPVTLDLGLDGSRDAFYNTSLILSSFPYAPVD